MAFSFDQCLIIDANVARSCADPARHETSIQCLKVTHILLRRVSKIGIATTPNLVEEWFKHGSPVFKKWWANMESRGRVRAEKDVRVSDYRSAISMIDDEGIRTAMLKDAHLVELALLKRYPVASQDDKQRRYVTDLSVHYGLTESIQWFNPSTDDSWDEWLMNDCFDREIFRCCAGSPE